MIKYPSDFVRQGALISLAMIMVQQNEAMNPKVGTIRKTLQKAIGDRHEDAMTKFGSAVSLGIIDEYWYWFPLTHFLSLSFTPTSVIALDQDLEVPSFKFHSATRPSLFDYPPEQETKVEDAPEKVKTAVLSTTAQAKRRAQKKERQQRRESMDIDPVPSTPKVSNSDDKMDTDEPVAKVEVKADGASKETDETKATNATEGQKKKVEKEKVGYELENMSRVLPGQLKFISFPDPRYEPVKKPTGGVILVIDTKPQEPKSLLELKARKSVKPAAAPTNTLQDQVSDVFSTRNREAETGAMGSGGAAEAVGVLNAVDEDGEGAEEADVPREFDYHSDEGEE